MNVWVGGQGGRGWMFQCVCLRLCVHVYLFYVCLYGVLFVYVDCQTEPRSVTAHPHTQR